jgi:hypothetical protein
MKAQTNPISVLLIVGILVLGFAYTAMAEDAFLESEAVYLTPQETPKGIVTNEFDYSVEMNVGRVQATSAPVYHTTHIIENDPIGLTPVHFKVDDATVSGLITNQGDKAFRFALILGEATIGDQKIIADYERGLIAYGRVAPGETVDISELVVTNGYDRLKANLEYWMGEELEAHIFIVSPESPSMRIETLAIDAHVEVGK